MADSWRSILAKILGENLIFEALPPQDLDALTGQATAVELEPESMLWAWGDEGKGVAVLLEGTLDVQRTFEDDRTVVFRRMSPGDVLGFSTLAKELHTADVVAPERALVALLPRDALRELLARRSDVALRVIGHLGHLVGLLTDEKVAWRTGSAKSRVSDWLRRHVDANRIVRITHAELAHHVGLSRENVSRAVRELAQDGVIADPERPTRGRIELLPPKTKGEGTP